MRHKPLLRTCFHEVCAIQIKAVTIETMKSDTSWPIRLENSFHGSLMISFIRVSFRSKKYYAASVSSGSFRFQTIKTLKASTSGKHRNTNPELPQFPHIVVQAVYLKPYDRPVKHPSFLPFVPTAVRAHYSVSAVLQPWFDTKALPGQCDASNWDLSSFLKSASNGLTQVVFFAGMAARDQLSILRPRWLQLLVQHDIFVSFVARVFWQTGKGMNAFEFLLNLSVTDTATVECWRRARSEAEPLTSSSCSCLEDFSWLYPWL